MNDKILDATELTEEGEPLSVDELFVSLLQDMILNNPPDDIATDFIENFVLQERDETPAILAMIDAPTDSVISLLEQVVTANYNGQLAALDAKGFEFIEGLKFAVKTRLEELAGDNLHAG